MKNHDACQHVKDAWDWKGVKVPFVAHITVVPGPRRGEEVIDDVHVDLDGAPPMGMQKYLSEPCDACKEVRERWGQHAPRNAREAMDMAKEMAEALQCKHNEASLFKEMARQALDTYMLKGPTPE